jgi:phospholipid/cholesterol/gamma-HCH transport system substrate-binding protein
LRITNETKVGVLAAVAITILIVGYSFLKGNNVFSNEKEFYAKYAQVEGLQVSKPVLVNGFQIGRVSELTLLPDGQILAQFQINPEYAIPKNTIARLESTDLLGGKAIVFELANSNEYLQEGDTLNANIQKNIMDQFASIARTLETLEGTTRKVDALVGSQSNHIASIVANLESISENFKNNNSKITSVMNNLDKITDEVARANFTQTIKNADKAVADMQLIVSKINTGEGSLGMLINDKKLYSELSRSAENLDKLMIDLKANPKRYVHLSVFGRKTD